MKPRFACRAKYSESYLRRLSVEQLEGRQLLSVTLPTPELADLSLDYSERQILHIGFDGEKDVASIGPLHEEGGKYSTASVSPMLSSVAATGDLTVTVEDENGLAVQGASAAIYDQEWTYIGEMITDAGGQATWPALNAGTYKLEAYYQGQYWVNDTVQVIGDQPTLKTLRRNEPYAFDFRVMQEGVGDVTGELVEFGSALTYEVRVTNDVLALRDVQVTLWIDRDQSEPYDFTEVCQPENLGGGSVWTFPLVDTVEETGTHNIQIKVETWVQDNWVLTDLWAWSPAVSVEAPDLTITVENQNEVAVQGAVVAMYDQQWNYIDEKTTDTNGQVSWHGTGAGTYRLEAYYNGEYWVNDTVEVIAEQPSLSTLRRNEPYAYDARIIEDGWGDVTLATTIQGAPLTYEVHVTNDVAALRDVQVTLWIDRDQLAPYDFVAVTPEQTLAELSVWTFPFHDTAEQLGAYSMQLKVEIWEQGGWVLTDSWAWGPAMQVEQLSDPGQEFFDDFSYVDSADPALAAFGWNVSLGDSNGPGAGQWNPELVRFVDDLDDGSNRLLRMVARVDESGTGQSEIATGEPRFLEGTYAARVLLSDIPVSPEGGDGTVQSFFTISDHDLGYDYSECDFEYLPNGSWTTPATAPRMIVTTWDYTDEIPGGSPDEAQSDERPGSLADAWHTLVIHVLDGEVSYFIDSEPLTPEPHGGDYYPESPMRIAFQDWIAWLADSTEIREYAWDIDWVYHAEDVAIPAWEANRIVNQFRSAGIARIDGNVDTTPPRIADFSYVITKESGELVNAELVAAFSEDVQVRHVDVVLLDSSGDPVAITSIGYEVATHRLTIIAEHLAENGTYTLRLLDTITDDALNPLDGEFDGHTFPSGNGGPGGDFVADVALVSATPGTPNLAATYDSGLLDDDNLTNRDNSTATEVLQFSVDDTIAGAAVRIYADGTEIGSTIATSNTTTVATNGSYDLIDGAHSITARQTESGRLESPDSGILPMTIDAIAPTIAAVENNDGQLRPNQLTSLAFTLSEDVGASIEVTGLAIHNDSTGEDVDLSALTAEHLAYDPVYHAARWDLSSISFPHAYYTYTLNAAGITDIAGNPLDGNGDGVDGDDYTGTLMVALNGDVNLNGSVDLADLTIMGHPNHWGQSGLTWLEGDLDLDGDVNMADLIILGDPSNWDKSLGIAGAPGTPPLDQVVYEPLQPPTHDEQTASGPKLPRFAGMLGVPRVTTDSALDEVSADVLKAQARKVSMARADLQVALADAAMIALSSEGDSDETESRSLKTELNPGLQDLLVEERKDRPADSRTGS